MKTTAIKLNKMIPRQQSTRTSTENTQPRITATNNRTHYKCEPRCVYITAIVVCSLDRMHKIQA